MPKWSSSAPLFDLAGKEKQIAENTVLMESPDFWNDQKKAQKIIKSNNMMKDLVETHKAISSALEDLQASIDELSSSFDEDMNELVQEEYVETMEKFSEFEVRVLLSGPYDDHNVILEIHPGAGGTEAMDWAGMLYRMYSRYCEKKGYKVTVMDYEDGEEAGVKSVTIKIEGTMAYGYLKAEAGVHRLVRISPFDSNARRHTSFASVDIMPEFEDDLEIEIDPSELEVITMRSSGAGGQHINKTDSAIRITHLPTGIVVECQDERSQHQNRARAMEVLYSRLAQLEEDKRNAQATEMRHSILSSGDRSDRIRTYNFPQSRITDHRINLTVYRLDEVLSGNLDLILKPVIEEFKAEQLAQMASQGAL